MSVEARPVGSGISRRTQRHLSPLQFTVICKPTSHASSWSCRIIHGPANLCSCNTSWCRNTLRGTPKIFSRSGTAEYDSTSIPRLCAYIMRLMLEVIGSSLGSQCSQGRVAPPNFCTSSWQLVSSTNHRYLITRDLQHGGNCGGTRSLMRRLIEVQTHLGAR